MDVVTKKYSEEHKIVISEAELQLRIAQLGDQISRDFQGRAVHCICVLENGFLFVADLIRKITCDIRCQFVKPQVIQRKIGNRMMEEILYTPDVNVEGQHVLLCEGILSTGYTTDFLYRSFQARGAASVSLCTLLNCEHDRRVELAITYIGFQVEPQWLAGFGLGSPTLNRNIPYIFAFPKTEQE